MKFFYFCILSFILIASITLTLSFSNLSRNESANQDAVSQVKAYEINLPVPQLTGDNVIPDLSSSAVLAVDLDSGEILYEKNPDTRLLPASTTKIVTALVAMDYYSLDDVLIAPNLSVEGQKMKLVAGEEISVKNLIYGILVYSANDAVEVLAKNYPGGKESFVTAMNLKVGEMGLTNTYFENPTGFDGERQYTTASDLVKIAGYAIKNPFFKEVVATKEIMVGSRNGEHIHRLININELIGEVDGVLGIKTGWTENAKENLVTYLERDDRKIITVVLGSRDRFADTKALIEWIFANYTWQEAL